MEFKTAALMGMGAIGSVYGKQLFAAYGEKFAALADSARAPKLRENGLRLNGETRYPRVAAPGDSAGTFDFILVCVKNYHLAESIAVMRPFVGPQTVFLPLLNGVTAAERLSAAFPGSCVLSGITIGIDAQRTADGVFCEHSGVIQFGKTGGTPSTPEISAAAACFARAGIKAEFYEDIDRVVWRKWMLNVGCNQVSAVTRAPYGKCASVPQIRAVMRAAMEEVVALAVMRGIRLNATDIDEIEKIVGSLAADGKTSMLQDVEASRRTEVDSFAGTMVEYGRRAGVATPVNALLYDLIHGIEASYTVK